MRHAIRIALVMSVLIAPAGCDKVRSRQGSEAPATEAPIRPAPRPASLAPPPPEDARTVEAFDTVSAAERAAAAVLPPADAAEAMLGRTVATLGNPAQAGLWLETPLARGSGPGRIVSVVTGESVLVDLIPIEGPGGAGSRVSLSALRLLGVALTGLHELEVYSR